MSILAPARTHDMEMLLTRRAQAPIFSHEWNRVQLKIDDLIEEGKCPTMHKQRLRLLNAARASDHDEILKISRQIDQHIKQHHPMRFKRAWVKEG